MRLLWTVALILSLTISPAQDAPRSVNILLVSPPGESWTPLEQSRAIGAAMDATAWWSRNSRVTVPSFELGWTATITPTDFSYSVFTWQRPYYTFPPTALTVFVIDNSGSNRTMDGALGWAQVPCQAITAVLGNDQERLAFVIAHEYGHAVFDLEHAPLRSFDIMAPAPSIEAYRTGTIGYHTRAAMGEQFKKVYLPLF